jgi:hypothetical protein
MLQHQNIAATFFAKPDSGSTKNASQQAYASDFSKAKEIRPDLLPQSKCIVRR